MCSADAQCRFITNALGILPVCAHLDGAVEQAIVDGIKRMCLDT